MFNTNKTIQNRENLLARSKEYKTEINKSILQYKRSMRTKVRQMQQKSPKDFWNYVKSLNPKPSNPDIKLDALHDFFETLNSTEHDDVVEGEIDANNLDLDMLNCEISEDEILKCIKKFKKRKVSRYRLHNA